MAKDRNAAASGIATLLPKLSDPDPDIRFMQLNDLANILNSPGSEYINSDTHTAARIIEGILKSLSDNHGEVQNQALKCVGPMTVRTPADIIAPLIDKLTNLTTVHTIDVSVPNTALRILIASLPHPQPSGIASQEVREACTSISKVLIPRLIGKVVLPIGKPAPDLRPGLLELRDAGSPEKGYSSEAVDVMIEIVKSYGSLLQDAELVAFSTSVMAIIESPHAGGVVKKRALAGIGALLVHFNDAQISQFVSALVESFQLGSQLTNIHRRFLIATIGTLARSTPSKFGPYLKELAPFVLGALSQDELNEKMDESDEDSEPDPEVEELREHALVALEAMLGSCPSEMQAFLPQSVDACLRFVKYDPNVADTEDEDMGGTQDTGSDDGVTEEDVVDDDDDEYAELDDDDAFSDLDDLSWKIRRCAAKALYTIISLSTAADQEIMFGRIAPALMSRLNSEREESVRLEIISATTALIKKIGLRARTFTVTTNGGGETIPSVVSRKRRRQDSGATLEGPDLTGLIQGRRSPPIQPSSPPTGQHAKMASLVPKIVQAVTRMWKKASLSLKQAVVVMLRHLALTRNGALADHLQQIEDALADALKPSASGSSSVTATSGSSATVASLQIETLSLISTIAETNANTVLIPFVIALISPVMNTVQDRNYKVSSGSLATIEQFVKALTPPRLATSNQDYAVHLKKLYDVVVGRIGDNNADLEVRHRAIQVFGVLLARTSSTKLLSPAARTKGLAVLNERLKNETTRLASARAIGIVAPTIATQDNISSTWVQDVSLEMAAQLRKSDRALRGSCLESLQYMALNPTTAALYEPGTIKELQSLLLPLLTVTDLHLLTPALIILAKIIPTNPQPLVDHILVQAMCSLGLTQLDGPPLTAFLLVIKVIGEQGVGGPLMKGLLEVGTGGEVLVVGKAIGTLMVFGGPNVGVTIPDFLKELQTGLKADVKSACLAITVLGEVGFRMGPSSPLSMDVFAKGLESDSDKVRLSSAMALGNASASNILKFLPIILQHLSSTVTQNYLYLYTLKEILLHSEGAAGEIAPYAGQLWQTLFRVSNDEDNRAIGAECIGRLAVIDPGTYVPELQKSLQSPDVAVRGTVISAFRFTLADSGSSYNALLAKTIIPMLTTMLSDENIENRRLAITTLNAAIHNKPELVFADFSKVLPLVLSDTYIKPELIKVISVGPFKINEDSGLDLRKSAYASLYALIETPAAHSQLSIPAIFDRILDGIPDDHDIRTMCNLMLARLTHIDPDETRRRLSALADKFKAVLGIKLKENAVRQDIDKSNSANASIVRTTLELDKSFPTAVTDGSGEMVVWRGYLEFVKKDFAPVVREVQEEGL